MLEAKERIEAIIREAVARCPDLHRAGFLAQGLTLEPVQVHVGDDFWFKADEVVLAAVQDIRANADAITQAISPAILLLLDYALAAEGIIPAYLGGISGLAGVIASH